MQGFEFELSTVTCFENRVISPWRYLRCQFDPDWIDGDFDEGRVQRALRWLDERGVRYHLNLYIKPDETPVSLDAAKILKLTFTVSIPTGWLAFLFRSFFPLAPWQPSPIHGAI